MEDNDTHCPRLFSPFTLRGLTLPNRLVMAPMSTSLGGTDGAVTPANIAFYRERALGGFGLIIVEFTCVDPSSGRTEEHQLSLESRRNLDGHRHLIDVLHDAGSKVFLQLQHGGRFSPARYLPGGVTKGPSAVSSRKDPAKLIVQPFTHEEVVGLAEAFGRTAGLAAEAGYDGIEVHGAHGYLLSQFLSPISNERDDDWGGDARRRRAFPEAVVRAIRAAVGDLPLCYRISADEFVPNGLSLDDTAAIVPHLVAAGADIIHVSTGRGPEAFDKVMEPISAPEGWRLPYARRLREASGVPVIGVGQIRQPEMAEVALTSGDCDLVALGRPSLTDPAWPNKAKAGRSDLIRPCTSCNWCISGATPSVTCAENPRTGHELDPVIPTDLGAGKRAVVVGAGPGGMSAALMLDQAGFDTHLFESDGSLGGGLVASATPPGKDKLFWYRDYLVRQLEDSGVELHLGIEANAEDIRALAPEVVFIATGTSARPFAIAGRGQGMLIEAYELLMQHIHLDLAQGEVVVVYGGGETGCETAEFLAERGAKVALVTRSSEDKLARSAEMIYRKGLVERLHANPAIEIIAQSEIASIDLQRVGLRHMMTGEERHISASRVLMAQGRNALNALAGADLAGALYVIGDSRQPGRIGDAVHSSYTAMLDLAGIGLGLEVAPLFSRTIQE